MTVMEPLLTSDEAAELLTIRPDTLTAWRHKKFGPSYIRVGRNIRYRRSDIEEWFESRVIRGGFTVEEVTR